MLRELDSPVKYSCLYNYCGQWLHNDKLADIRLPQLVDGVFGLGAVFFAFLNLNLFSSVSKEYNTVAEKKDDAKLSD